MEIEQIGNRVRGSKSWIDHPAFHTANPRLRECLRQLAFDYGKAIKDRDVVLAADLVEEAKQFKWDLFPFGIIRGGKS